MVWGALMALLLLTVGAAMLPLGAFNVTVSLAIAAIKALLVLIFFMRLKTDITLLWFVAAAGFLWLALLVSLTLADLSARGPLLPS